MAISIGTSPEERAARALEVGSSQSLANMQGPRLMELAVLTAAIQEPGLTAEDFRRMPEQTQQQAGLNWIEIARGMGKNIGRQVGLQLAANLPAPDDYAAGLMDPVACHVNLRTFKGKGGAGVDLPDDIAREMIKAMGNDVKIHSLSAFLNLLHDNDEIREQVHAHTLRVARAALSLGVTSLTGFIGRNPLLNDDQNIAMFEKEVIPLLQELQKLGIKKFRVEPCPMIGWDIQDNPIKNIAYAAPTWIRLARICEKHGVGDMFRVTYDESHSTLMGQNHYEVFASLAAVGYAHIIDEFHGKGLEKNLAKIAAHGEYGQKIGLGIRDAQGNAIAGNEGNAWGRYTGHHILPGSEPVNPEAETRKLQADWEGHQYHARAILGIHPANAVWILEHEANKGGRKADGTDGPNLRVQNVDLVVGALTHSLGYVAAVDAAAERKFLLRNYLEKNGVWVPGADQPQFYSPIPGLAEEVRRSSGMPEIPKSAV